MTTSLLLSVFFTLTAVPSALAQSCPAPYEYIIVGAGPGGGPLAARLALAGHKTLLIDAGDDEGALEDYQVPLLYSWAPENPAMNWNYFVRQYDDDAMAKASEKSVYAFPNGT
jgi:choline dehydrogenase